MVDPLFLASLAGMALIGPLHFLSVEHVGLERRFGTERGRRIGEVAGLVSGWGFFAFWAGVWLSPQPRFVVPLGGSVSLLGVPIVHVVLGLLFLAPGFWLGVAGVRELTLRVSETHRADGVVSSGVYSLVRHPQYLGGVLSHVGVSLLLSGLYSLAVTPLVLLLNFVLCLKEEKELLREFGEEYGEYMRRVPMLVPRLRR